MKRRSTVMNRIHWHQAALSLGLAVISALATVITIIGLFTLEPYSCFAQEPEIASRFARGLEIPEADSDRRLEIGNQAPDITLPDVSGKTWSREEYGKTRNAHSRLLYIFVIMNCGPCREALKYLLDNSHSLKDTEVVVISFGPKMLTVKELQRIPLPFTVLCDEDSETYVKYHLTDTPTLILTEDDTITYMSSGWDDTKQDELIQAIMNRQ